MDLYHFGCKPRALQRTSNSSDTATPAMPDPGRLELHMPASKLPGHAQMPCLMPPPPMPHAVCLMPSPVLCHRRLLTPS